MKEMKMMDESTNRELAQLQQAFRSLSRSVEKGLLTDMYAGAGDVVVRSYRALHAKAVELLPDDYYVAQVLDLELPADAGDRQKLAAVSLQTNQMVDYLDGFTHADAKAVFSGPDMEELRSMGRDIQEQILSVTRNTLKRAMANIDITVQRATPPEPPQPPEPPEAPEPPKAKRKIEIADDDDEDAPADDGMV
jgi:hypothetical protein